MNGRKLKTDEYLDNLKTPDNNVKDFYYTYLKGRSEHTQLSHLIDIKYLFDETGKNNVADITKDDFYKLLEGSWWNSLSKSSQKLHMIHFRMYFKFSERKNLAKLCIPKNYNETPKELNEQDIISRIKLKQILNEVKSTKLRALIVTLYTGALRKSELLNIKRKDVVFENKRIRLFIWESKSKKRNIPLEEFCIPYLRQYINDNRFQPNDYLFKYSNPSSLNGTFNAIRKRLEKKFPEQWTGRKLNPHLLRHSRMTELGKIHNEQKLNKFGGWSENSKMTARYVHLYDSDIMNMFDEEYEKPKLKPFEVRICPHCRVKNSLENVLCYKCNKPLDKTGEYMDQDEKIEQLQNDINELKEMFNIVFSTLKETDKDYQLNNEYVSFMDFLKEKVLSK